MSGGKLTRNKPRSTTALSLGDVLQTASDMLTMGLGVFSGQHRSLIPPALFVLVVLSLVGPIMFRRPESLLAWVVLAAILILHARDISGARCRLREAVENPSGFSFDDRNSGVSSVVVQLDLCARAFCAAENGRVFEAERIAATINRELLDSYSSRVFDATLAICMFAKGNAERACSFALVSIPIGNPTSDLVLATRVLAHAWQAESRLQAITNKWRQEPEPLVSLAQLSALRCQVLSGATTVDLSSQFSPEQVEFLSQVAGKLGDEALSSRLLSYTKRHGPYR
jgi:hypothetical protein